MSVGDELRGMVMTFRVSELQMLLGYASQNKTGRKSELQARALSLLKNKSVPHLTQIHAKIRELYKTIQQGAAAGEVTSNALLTPSSQRPGQSSSAGPPQVIPPTPTPPVSSTPLNSQPITNTFMSLSSRQNVYGSMYGYQQAKVPPTPSLPMQFPQQVMHPDVNIKRLPFYDVLSELIKPSSLAGSISGNSTPRGHESSFIFYLSPQQASAVASNRDVSNGKNEYPVQIQLRFCLLETSSEQEDIFPPGISVKVNSKQATLPNPIPTNRPGVEPKRPPRPVNISHLCKLCPFEANHIKVSWSPDYTNGYVLVLHLVKKLSADDLFKRLKCKGVRVSDCTRGLIKEKFNKTDNDCEIATTSLRVSLLCPLGKMKMSNPARSLLCSHLQCFDASLYLQMNEKRPTWTCPVCDKPIPYDTLVIDGYFQDVLNSPELASDQHEVQLLKDGSWACPAPVVKEKPVKENYEKGPSKEVIEEILDEEEEVSSPGPSILAKEDKKEDKKKKMVEIDLTASDSDVEEHPPTKIETPVSINSHHTLSEGSNSSVGGRSLESSVIMLDSPSPPESRATTPIVSALSGVSSAANTLNSSVSNTNCSSPGSIASNATTASIGSHHMPSYTSTSPSSHMYPQIIQGAGQNLNRPLVMQIRMPPPATQNHGRYHPY